jgi:hypothetical protein
MPWSIWACESRIWSSVELVDAVLARAWDLPLLDLEIPTASCRWSISRRFRCKCRVIFSTSQDLPLFDQFDPPCRTSESH